MESRSLIEWGLEIPRDYLHCFGGLVMKKYLKIGLVVATCALILFVFVLVRLLFLPTASNTKKIEDYGQFRLYSNYEMRSDLLAFPNEISKENMVEYLYSRIMNI